MPMKCQATSLHCAIPFHADAGSAVAGPQAASCSAVVAVGCKGARDFPRFLRDSQAQRSLLIRPRALASVNDLTQIARFPCGATGIVLLFLCDLFSNCQSADCTHLAPGSSPLQVTEVCHVIFAAFCRAAEAVQCTVQPTSALLAPLVCVVGSKAIVKARRVQTATSASNRQTCYMLGC